MTYNQLKYLTDKIALYEEILDEIREYIKEHSFFVDDTGYKKIIGYPKETYNAQDLLGILDKVKEKD